MIQSMMVGASEEVELVGGWVGGGKVRNRLEL